MCIIRLYLDWIKYMCNLINYPCEWVLSILQGTLHSFLEYFEETSQKSSLYRIFYNSCRLWGPIKKYCYYIDSSVLSYVPSEINVDNSHCEINSVISLSDFLPPKHHNIYINPPITEFKIHVENIDKLWRKLYKSRIINWLS